MKRNLVGIFALVLAIGFSSFTSKRALDKWFEYVGATNAQGDVFAPNNYTDLGATIPSNPANTLNKLAFIHVEELTEVYATGSFAGKPIVNVSSAIRTDLNNNVVIPSTPSDVTNRIYIK